MFRQRAAAKPPRQVLVVDDELQICLLLTRWLEQWGYAARHVVSADEAIDVLAEEPVDILLCDIIMPERDGIWLAGQVHERWPNTSVVMITGYDDSKNVRLSRAAGAKAFVTKPFDIYLLRQALETASATA